MYHTCIWCDVRDRVSFIFYNLSLRLLRTFAFTEVALKSCVPDCCQHAASLNSNAIRLRFRQEYFFTVNYKIMPLPPTTRSRCNPLPLGPPQSRTPRSSHHVRLQAG